jgi:hypothetical protein
MAKLIALAPTSTSLGNAAAACRAERRAAALRYYKEKPVAPLQKAPPVSPRKARKGPAYFFRCGVLIVEIVQRPGQNDLDSN